MHPGIQRLNAMPLRDAEAALLQCCGSTSWAERIVVRRPFESPEELFEYSDLVWWELGREDWFEAFRAHPRIGGKTAAKATAAQARAWSEEEQAEARGASRDVQAALAEANRAYEARFGYIFIVCATGKTSEEMLALLQKRLQNEPRAELRIAAEEQRRITRLRLEKLLRG